MPSSTTSSTACAPSPEPSCDTRSSTVPPGRLNFTALVTRFWTARISWLRSPSTTTGPAGWTARIETSRLAAVSRMSATTSVATPRRSTGSTASSVSSARDSASRLTISSLSRSRLRRIAPIIDDCCGDMVSWSSSCSSSR